MMPKSIDFEAPEPIEDFSSVDDAIEWMSKLVDDPCVDNNRLAYLDDTQAMLIYNAQAAKGCCGSFDETVKINGRLATIGCNYGH